MKLRGKGDSSQRYLPGLDPMSEHSSGISNGRRPGPFGLCPIHRSPDIRNRPSISWERCARVFAFTVIAALLYAVCGKDISDQIWNFRDVEKTGKNGS